MMNTSLLPSAAEHKESEILVVGGGGGGMSDGLGGVTTTATSAAATTTATAPATTTSVVDKPMKHPLDPQVCQKAARYAVRVYEEMSRRSTLLRKVGTDDDSHDPGDDTTCRTERSYQSIGNGVIAQFHRDDVMPHLGEMLGRGGFNSVYSLKSNVVLVDAHTGRRVVNARNELAVKFLSDDAMAIAEEFCNGAADLYMEAKYLTALAAHPHPGLIQLHGICASGPNGFCRTERAGFFLVIDRLYDTLDRRMDVWKELSRRRASQPVVLQALFLQRLIVAQDIASAVRHLHKLNVVFRDLKPGE